LSFLAGKEICQICIGSYDVQFNWGKRWDFSLEQIPLQPGRNSRWVVWAGESPESATPVIHLLKASITSVETTKQGSLLLKFSNMDQLQIFEDERHESFNIKDGTASTIIV